MGSTLPVGVIGLGRLGFQHAVNVKSQIREAELVAVADPVEASLEKAKDRFEGLKTYRDYHDLIDDTGVKAVIIASPTKTHAEISKYAVKSGKYIFCEKPIAFTMEEAQAVRDLVEKHSAYYQAGFMRRFDPGYKAAKNRIEAGEIGEPVYFKGITRDPDLLPEKFIKNSGGLIFDMCIHDIDLARWYLGEEPYQVYAQGDVVMYDQLKDWGDIDQTTLIMKFNNNKFSDVEASRNARYGYDVRSEIIGKKGALMVGQYKNKPYILYKEKGSREEELIPEFYERFENAFVREIKEFINRVKQGEESPVTAHDGFMGNKIAEAAQQSLEQNLPVAI